MIAKNNLKISVQVNAIFFSLKSATLFVFIVSILIAQPRKRPVCLTRCIIDEQPCEKSYLCKLAPELRARSQ